MDEIADALSISDTGFLVHSRYDLSGQGAKRAGLTEEQKNEISHRGKALRSMKKLLHEYGF